MKKAFKYIMLALLIIPCALVFTACGSKGMTNKEFARYTYDSYVEHIKGEDYENYKDIKVSVALKTTGTSTQELEVKNADSQEVETKSFEIKEEENTTLTYERTGKGNKVVVKVTKATTTTTTSPNYDESAKTVDGNVVVTETETTTYYLGGITTAAGEEPTMKYYAVKEYEKTKMTSVKGEKPDEDASVKENNGKTVEEISSEEEFKTNVETLVEAANKDLFDAAYQTALMAIVKDMADGLSITGSSISKDGKTVKVNLEMVLGYEEMFAEANYDCTFDDAKLSKISFETKAESVEGTENGTETYTYSYTSNAKLPANLEDASTYVVGEVIGDSFENDMYTLFSGLGIM